jgi:hypothetical protein
MNVLCILSSHLETPLLQLRLSKGGYLQERASRACCMNTIGFVAGKFTAIVHCWCTKPSPASHQGSNGAGCCLVGLSIMM